MTFKKLIKDKLINVKDKYILYKERRKFGFTHQDLWCLDQTIAKFVLPRLKAFRKVNYGYPSGMTKEEWDKKIDDMIFAMDYCLYMWNKEYNKKDQIRINKGMREFGKYFFHLWI